LEKEENQSRLDKSRSWSPPTSSLKRRHEKNEVPDAEYRSHREEKERTGFERIELVITGGIRRKKKTSKKRGKEEN